MRLNGTAVRARHQDGPVSPVISGENGWLGDDGRDQPLTLQLSLPVSAEELAVGSQPPSTTTLPRPRTLEKAVPSGPGTGPGSPAYVRQLAETASPRRAGN
jgi:hypothetical protein